MTENKTANTKKTTKDGEKTEPETILQSLTIAGKSYPLYFGFDFIRELDKKYTDSFAGMQFGYGVGKILIYLIQRNPIGVLDFILAATNTLNEQPKEWEIEQMFSIWDINELCENFITLLEHSPLTKPQLEMFAAAGAAMLEQGKK